MKLPLFALFLALTTIAQGAGDVTDVRVVRALEQEPSASLLGQPSA